MHVFCFAGGFFSITIPTAERSGAVIHNSISPAESLLASPTLFKTFLWLSLQVEAPSLYSQSVTCFEGDSRVRGGRHALP